MSVAQDTLSVVKDYLAREADVYLAYLFGSRVCGTVGPLSDYDLGLLLQPHPSLERRYSLHRILLRLLGTDRLDVVFLHEVPVELAYAIIAQGQLLYQRELAIRVEFEAQVLSRYGDYLPILRAQREAILHGGSYEARIQRYREALRRTERTLAALRTAQRETTG